MKTVSVFLFGFLFGFIFGATANAGSLAQGFGTICGEYKEVMSHLEKTFRESRFFIGLTTDGAILEAVISPKGTFTIIITQPNGLSCLMIAGENGEITTPTPKGPQT